MNRLLLLNKRFWMIGGVVAVLLLLIAGQTPAAAHTRKIHQGRDLAVVSPDHRSGAVCDEKKDGHGVVAQYMTQGGTEVELYDDDDRNSYGSAPFHSKAFQFRLCETRGPFPVYCTRWYRT